MSSTKKDFYYISREIGIDAGHRVWTHGSKCYGLHGHRYRIVAECRSPILGSGVESGMVIDFGFLKEEMILEIDNPCDHGMILDINDKMVGVFLSHLSDEDIFNMSRNVKDIGYHELPLIRGVDGDNMPVQNKIYLVDFVPTAENLAKHWFTRLSKRVTARTEGRAELSKVIVWETPNCCAHYGIGE